MEPSVVARLENIADRMECLLFKYSNVQNGAATLFEPATPSLPPKTPSMENFDLDMKEKLTDFVVKCGAHGEHFALFSEPIFDIFMEQRDFLEMAAGRQKPSTEEEFRELMEGMVSAQSKIDLLSLNIDNKDDYVSAIQAAASFINWNNPFCYPGPPGEFLGAVLDEMMFYLNRVLVNTKNSDKEVFEIAKSTKELFYTFRKHVVSHHPKGVVWNTQPRSVASNGGAPPPPPPPPPLCPAPSTKKESPITALMADLNTGLSATSRLKKVTKEQKNAAGEKRKETIKVPEKAKKVEKGQIVWNGQRWMVENLMGDMDAVINVTEMKMPIYVYNCQQSRLLITGKANSIVIDNCKELVVCCDGLVASCEVINSCSVEVQTRGQLPTISIQGTRGCHIFLPEEHPDTQIVSSASTNMLVTVDRQNGASLELPIPEQFVSRIDGNKLVTKQSETV